MASKTLASLLVLAGLSNGQYDRYGPIRKNITWSSCVTVGAPPAFLCGEFDVPLDYTDVTRGKATLAVIKYSSTVQPRKGTIFLNPGGPGEPGLDFLISTGASLSNSSGGQYDIISWDPRGVGLSYPRIRCFNSTAEQTSFWQGTAPSQGIESKGNFSNADGTDPNELAFWKQEPLVDYLLFEVGQKCWAENGDHLSYVGTAAVTRDIVAMHDVIEGPGSLINYWGYSYGTVIGNFLVNMFPHRVGRVILDGVLNPIFWSDVPSYKIWAYAIQDIEKVFAGFTTTCAAAGSTSCVIATNSSTSASILKWIRHLMDDAFDYHKAGGSFGSATIRLLLLGSMYTPITWPALATQLRQLSEVLHKNGTSNGTSPAAKRTLVQPITLPVRPSGPLGIWPRTLFKRTEDRSTFDYAIYAISCGDAADPGDTTTADIFKEIISASYNVSQTFGPSFVDPHFWCQRWPVRAAERFYGPWNHKPRTSILLISNTADPITPHAGAEAVADAYGDGAVLVTQNGYGHTSLAEHSDCTQAIINAFFTNGTYPPKNTVCQTNQVLFP